MWRSFGDLLRTRGPAGALIPLVPGLLGATFLMSPFWLPAGNWAAEHQWELAGLGIAFAALALRAWVVETRRWRKELSRNPIHRWPPLPAHDLSFIRTRIQRR